MLQLKRWIPALLSIFILLAGTPLTASASQSSQHAMYTEYYKRVRELRSQYGIKTNSELSGSGLVHADLIDFDGNGVPELYVIYSINYRYSPVYYEEIWMFHNGNMKKVYEEMDEELGLVGDRALALTSAAGKSYLNYTSSYVSGRGDYPYDNNYTLVNSFLALVGDQMVEVARTKYFSELHAGTGEERETYVITENGKERTVSEQEYRNVLQRYGIDNRKEFVESSAGAKSFTFDMPNNRNRMHQFMRSLTDKIRAKNLGTNQISGLGLEDKNELTAFLFQFSAWEQFDTRHYTDGEVLRYMKDIWFNGLIDDRWRHYTRPAGESIVSESFYPHPWYFDPYSAEGLNELAEELFGITLERKSNEFAFYDKGFFYLPEYNFGSNPGTAFPRVTGYYPLGNDLYYVDFDLYGISPEEIINRDRYRNAYETLTEQEKSVAEPYGSGYAILHKSSNR